MTQSCRRGGCPHRRPSELDALVAEHGCSVTAIDAAIDRIMDDVKSFEGMVSVTANAAAVMTHVGGAPAVSHVGEALAWPARGAALRVDPAVVASTLAVDRPAYGRSPCSVQFYASEGAALHKLFFASLTDDYAFAEMTRDWAAPCARPLGRASDLPADAADWRDRNLGFHVDSLFGDSGLRRRALLPGWGEDHAWRIGSELAVHLLGLVAEIRAPVTAIVPNAGFAQSYAGPYDGLRRAGDRLRLAGESCSISLNVAEVEEVWVTRHGSDGGTGLAVEFYDWGYQCVALFAESGDDDRLRRFWNRNIQQIPRIG